MSRALARPLGAALIAMIVLVTAVGVGTSDGKVHGEPPLDAVIIGDSLTGGNRSYIGSTISRSGLFVQLEGLSARRIAVSSNFFGYRDSGIERVRTLQADGVDAALWVIQLGTNDLRSIERCGCADPVAFAGALIDQLLDVIGPNTPTAWVTVVDRTRWDAARAFNEALAVRAATNPYLALIHWGELAAPHPEWFKDHVHPNQRGLVAFTQMYISGIRKLLADPLGVEPPADGLRRADRLGPA